MIPAQKSDGLSYYEYVLLYTYDVLVIIDNGEKIFREGIGLYFYLKYDSVGAPKIYIWGYV